MDYKKIYLQFIADRLAKSVAIDGYSEVHHILPKAFGGTDDPKNLIRLTPEDHIRAHLLLAKVYGGRMWAPVIVLCSSFNGRIPTKRAIKAAALARKHHGESMRGDGNPFFGKSHTQETIQRLRDSTVYRIGGPNGELLSGTQFELATMTGVSNRSMNRICLGQRRTCQGWFNFDIYGKNGPLSKADATREWWRKNQSEVVLYHKDGRVWKGYPVDAPVAIDTIKSGHNLHVKGWFLSINDRDNHDKLLADKCKKNAQSRGDISGDKNPRADNTVYSWRNTVTGEVIQSKRVDMWKSGRCPKSGVTAIFSGVQKKAGVWEKL
jgi:hypothetical protein